MNELIKLIDTNPEEAIVQNFFEKHPASIIGAAYALSNALIAKLPLGVDFVTDFTWVNPRSGPTYVYLIEIEKPSKSIFNQDNSFTQSFNHAYGQVEDWLGWCSKCKYPGKPTHSLLEIFRHTDYVPGGVHHA